MSLRLPDRRALPVVAALLLATAATQAPPTPVTIHHVAVVDVEAGTVLRDRTVLLDDGRIRSIAAATKTPADGVVVDGTGKYLIPGLWDLHVHLRHRRAPAVMMPQYLVHGVTGVRDMDADCPVDAEPSDVCLPDMIEWRRRIDAGEMVGPRLLALSSGAWNPPWDAPLDEAAVREVVKRARARGADLMKVYYRPRPQAFEWFMDEARRQGMPVSGHVPLRITLREASDLGLRSVEHARDLLFDCFPGAAGFRETARSQAPDTATLRAMVAQHDVTACEQTFRTMVARQTWYVPTHVTRRMDAFADVPSFRNDARARYIPTALWADWNADADRMVALDPSPAGRAAMRGFYEAGLAVTGRAFAAGVKVLVGTDAGDSFVFPGSSVHDEMSELVKAGLTPAQALAAATVRSAEFLGLQAEHGTVAIGRRADLVLLAGNPLTDIGNTRHIDAVILGGRVLPRGTLDEMLAGVARAVAAQ